MRLTVAESVLIIACALAILVLVILIPSTQVHWQMPVPDVSIIQPPGGL